MDNQKSGDIGSRAVWAGAGTSESDGMAASPQWAVIRVTTARFRTPSVGTSVGQIANSFLP